MIFNKHSDLEAAHAFLSPSKYHWLNYDDDKLRETYLNQQAIQKGTELHKFACDSIRLGINLPKNRKTLNMYVNDAIGFKMQPEVPLVYSMNCFGTADSICFRNGLLRIHDLKTGATPANMKQLEIYNALFCLEYGLKPKNIRSELRIYQNDEIVVHNPVAGDIQAVMDRIISSDRIIEKMKQEVKV